jgi:hypothetical protein
MNLARPTAAGPRKIAPMKRVILGLAVGLLLAVGGSQAGAATTFGSNLSGDPVISASTSPDTTYAMSGIAPAGVALGGAVAPSDGVVVRWRVRVVTTQDPGVTAALRVIRGDVGHGTGATESIPAAAGTYTFPTRLPIEAEDLIGIDTSGGLRYFAFGMDGDLREDWSPALPDGGSRPPDYTTTSSRVELNADVEPDVDGDGYGDETQDQCPGNPAVQAKPCDRTPPKTTITTQRKNKGSKTTAKFKFTSSEPASTFECRLKGKGLKSGVKKFRSCTSPAKYKHLDPGKYKFQVRATDAAGNTDSTPAKDKFKVVG